MDDHVITAHQVNRLTLRIDAGYPDFRERFERAAPALPAEEVAEFARRRGSWPEMVDWIDRIAPHGFLIYARIEVDPVMGLAGHAVAGTEYLMGNHLIAERMFRHDPAVMLHAPLRLFLWERPGGGAGLAVDQPSNQFASYGRPEISAVGVELDRKLAALLHHLGAPVPPVLGGC